MSSQFIGWGEVKVKAAAVDIRTPAEREAGRVAAAERREAYVRGHQLAEIRRAAGLTQAQLQGRPISGGGGQSEVAPR